MGMGGGIRKGWDRDGVGSGRSGIRMGWHQDWWDQDGRDQEGLGSGKGGGIRWRGARIRMGWG